MSKIWWVRAADLDDDQKKVLALPPDGKHLVTGPPGSGKSNLLILRAKYLIGMGKQNFRVLAFNQTLVRFLRAGKAVPDDKIVTAQSWLENQLWDLEAQSINEPVFEKKRPALCAALLRHLRQNKKQGLIHTLLIDEVQDYSTEEISLFDEIAENLFLVGDIRQAIDATDTTHRTLEEMRGRFNVVELETHYRIGRNICALADRIARPSKGHKLIGDGCRYDEAKNESKVEHIVLPLPEQIAMIGERIKNQLDTFPDEFIGVLCPTNDVLDVVASELERSLGTVVNVQRSQDYHDFDLKHPVIVSTIHSGKGLEYRCVHIPSTETLKKGPRSRELIYTAVTRAKTSVVIYNHEPLHDFLEDALRGGLPPAAPLSIDALF